MCRRSFANMKDFMHHLDIRGFEDWQGEAIDMKAITTQFKGWTETKPSRIVAFDSDGNKIEKSVGTLEDEVGKSSPFMDEIHRAAAQALCNKMGWSGRFVTGATKQGYVHVFIDKL